MYRKAVKSNIVGLLFCEGILREALFQFLPFIDVEDNRTDCVNPLGSRTILAHRAALMDAAALIPMLDTTAIFDGFHERWMLQFLSYSRTFGLSMLFARKS